MIASIAFRNFKALRQASVELCPFNLVVGPNGSGKSSLIEAFVRLRTLARLPLAGERNEPNRSANAPEVTFRFTPPYDRWEAVMSCASDDKCDLLNVFPLSTGEGVGTWEALREKLLRMRRFELDHAAIARPAPRKENQELKASGANLAPLLLRWRDNFPAVFSAWASQVLRVFPEYDDILIHETADGEVALSLRIAGERTRVPAQDLSQGTLYALVVFALAADPDPPSVICIEELDRGLHPRILREVQDAMYSLSHPSCQGLAREPVQVLATSHSPYFLDLFRDHVEEIILTEKHGSAAHFKKLTERRDLGDLLEGASLGDLWYTGILGGVPTPDLGGTVTFGERP
ncbi:MAG: AAA family ATPase [Opitutaceae bacterium]|nr:AAA family ATPase [Opitutaceae bacterium]